MTPEEPKEWEKRFEEIRCKDPKCLTCANLKEFLKSELSLARQEGREEITSKLPEVELKIGGAEGWICEGMLRYKKLVKQLLSPQAPNQEEGK